MTIKLSKPESKRELAPAGTHRAVLYKVVNLGTLKTEWEGKERDSHKIRLYWELSDKKIKYEKDGKEVEAPFSVGRKLTYSMGDNSHFYPIVQGMTGGLTEDERWNFDVESLLGVPCLITLVHDEFNGTKYAKVTAATQLLEGMEKPVQVNPNEVLDVQVMSKEEIDELPEFIADDMRSSREYKLRFEAPRTESPEEEVPESVKAAEKAGEELKDSDIPF